MGYDLVPRNKTLDTFTIGAFSFPLLLEACGYLWPCFQENGRWYCVFGVDKRMPAGDTYPTLISNDGFPVTAEESRILARIARNYVAIQRSLPNPEEETPPENPFSLTSKPPGWPMKIRTDFVDKFERFAEWAEKSQGFRIW